MMFLKTDVVVMVTFTCEYRVGETLHSLSFPGLPR